MSTYRTHKNKKAYPSTWAWRYYLLLYLCRLTVFLLACIAACKKVLGAGICGWWPLWLSQFVLPHIFYNSYFKFTTIYLVSLSFLTHKKCTSSSLTLCLLCVQLLGCISMSNRVFLCCVFSWHQIKQAAKNSKIHNSIRYLTDYYTFSQNHFGLCVDIAHPGHNYTDLRFY